MLTVNGEAIAVSQGDTGSVTLTFSGEVADGTEAVVTVKKRPGMTEPLLRAVLTVEGNQALWELSSEDTALPVGAYCYDVRLVGDAFVHTPMAPHPFVVAEVVGDV